MGAYSSVDIRLIDEKKFRFALTGELREIPPGWLNFTIGVKYESGPSSVIVLEQGGAKYEFGIGETLPVSSTILPPPPTEESVELESEFYIHFPEEGTYVLKGVSGTLRGGVFYVDDEDEIKIVVRKGEEGGEKKWGKFELATERGAVSATVALLTVGAVSSVRRRVPESLLAGALAGLFTYLIYPRVKAKY